MAKTKRAASCSTLLLNSLTMLMLINWPDKLTDANEQNCTTENVKEETQNESHNLNLKYLGVISSHQKTNLTMSRYNNYNNMTIDIIMMMIMIFTT